MNERHFASYLVILKIASTTYAGSDIVWEIKFIYLAACKPSWLQHMHETPDEITSIALEVSRQFGSI